MLISKVMVHKRAACSNRGIFNLPSSSITLIKLIEARLHAVSSKKLYSEQGLEALMRPLSGQVCQSLIVVSNCIPGSAQDHAA
ncbi:MAG: hypothetical protein ACD_69C00181G0004 [uncultured bacterium]|nr:MAG: hypothetical protein ACD_69C00181G0004 [uncultured bacterium]